MDQIGASLFPGDQAEWFLADGDQSVGPLRAADIYAELTQGKISYMQYIWKAGMTAWARICDVPTFQVAAPSAPPAPPKMAQPPKPPTAAVPPKKEWFLFYSDTQSGPYTRDEACGVVGLHHLDSTSVFIWKEGMAGWLPFSEVSDFAGIAPAAPTSSEKRAAVRRPIIAKVLLAEGAHVSTGIGRDISIGGMQVLSAQVPKKVGATVKLNVSPTQESSPSFAPFVAEGIVVRIFEDGRGFSFRFGVLAEAARATIEKLVASGI